MNKRFSGEERISEPTGGRRILLEGRYVQKPTCTTEKIYERPNSDYKTSDCLSLTYPIVGIIVNAGSFVYELSHPYVVSDQIESINLVCGNEVGAVDGGMAAIRIEYGIGLFELLHYYANEGKISYCNGKLDLTPFVEHGQVKFGFWDNVVDSVSVIVEKHPDSTRDCVQEYYDLHGKCPN